MDWIRASIEGTRLSDWIMIGIQGLTMVAVTVYALYAYKLVVESRKQVAESRRSADLAQQAVADARKQAEADLRPWVTVKKAAFANLLQVGQLPQGIVYLQNTGKTPALNMTIVSSFSVGVPLPEGPMPRFPLPGQSLALLGPSSEYFTASSRPVAVTGAEVAAFKAGQLNYFVFGVIKYSGPHGGEYQTEYAFEAVPGNATGDANFCTKWNSAK